MWSKSIKLPVAGHCMGQSDKDLAEFGSLERVNNIHVPIDSPIPLHPSPLSLPHYSPVVTHTVHLPFEPACPSSLSSVSLLSFSIVCCGT